MKCPYCNNKNADTAKYCQFCGKEIIQEAKSSPVDLFENDFNRDVPEKADGKRMMILAGGIVLGILIISLAVFFITGKSDKERELAMKQETQKTESLEAEKAEEVIEEAEEEVIEEAEEAVAEEEDAEEPEEVKEPEQVAEEPKEEPVEKVVPEVSMSAIRETGSSSYLSEPQYNLVHDAAKLLDGDVSTAWVEDASGQGIGESVSVYFDSQYVLSGINIYNGHQYNSDIFYKNSRPSEIEIICDGGVVISRTLTDSMGKQTITFDTPVKTSGFTIKINSVYPGSKYEDTCISELSVF